MLPTCHLVTPGTTVKDMSASAGLEAGGQDKASRTVFGQLLQGQPPGRSL